MGWSSKCGPVVWQNSTCGREKKKTGQWWKPTVRSCLVIEDLCTRIGRPPGVLLLCKLLLPNILWLRSTPHPVTVTTRIITFLVGNPYKPSFATVTGWGVDPIYNPSLPNTLWGSVWKDPRSHLRIEGLKWGSKHRSSQGIWGILEG